MFNKNWKFRMIILILIISCAAIVFTVSILFGFNSALNSEIKRSEKIGFDKGYKAACIDFYNGKLKYEPVKKEIIEWKEVKK